MLNQINEQKINRLAELLNVLADPIRVQIVLSLTKSASVSDLQRCLQIGQNTLSKHLIQMQRNGLLTSEYRNGETYYSLTDMRLNKAVKLITG